MAPSRFGGLRVRKLSMVCLHNNAIVARCILDTNIALWDTRTASAPSILLVLLEPHSNYTVVVYQRHVVDKYRGFPIETMKLIWNSHSCNHWASSVSEAVHVPDSVKQHFLVSSQSRPSGQGMPSNMN